MDLFNLTGQRTPLLDLIYDIISFTILFTVSVIYLAVHLFAVVLTQAVRMSYFRLHACITNDSDFGNLVLSSGCKTDQH